MKTIHTILVAFNNAEQTKTRWLRDALPALNLLDDVTAVVTVVDNSRERSSMLADLFGAGYLWQEGENRQYGPSINLAVQRVPSDLCLYLCTKHGTARDPSYLTDLMAPFNDHEVGMTGYLVGSNSPEGVAYGVGGKDWIKEAYRFVDDYGNGYVPQHVQGGIWMARTQALLEHPYHPDVPHLYSDHIVTWNLLKAGWKCINVPSILSVWRSAIHNPGPELKYLHADNWT